MRLAAAAIALSGCGRQNFASVDDAAPQTDAQVDVMADADTRLPGLIAWYAMEDSPADGEIADSGGGGHPALCVTGLSCPTQVAGKRGSALAFDGTQYARITYGPWLATSTAYTIAGWIYLDQQIDQVAFAKPWGSDSYDSWGITAWSPGATLGTGTCLETVDGAMNSENVCGPVLPAGQWFHVAGRWTGSAKAMFINGVKAAELLSTPTSLIDTHDAIIGGDENSGSPAYLFHGKVDEVQLYDRALTDAEIAMLAL